jgi:prepilin-type N-terminal cleavage/methylation domain-containing protein
MRNRGFTLIELMISLAIMIIIALGATATYEIAVGFQIRELPQRQVYQARERFENRIRALIRSAYLSPGGGAAPSYFMAGAGGIGGAAGMQAGSAPADVLTFTATAPAPLGAFLESQNDFETLNEQFGPQGGLAEVSISVTPVGEEAGSRTGPFLRTQRPADGDFTQGGFEELLDANVHALTFEFYDGTAWVPEWDTSTTPRLPAAVRITYTWQEEDTPRVLIVRLPLSDVTPENPAGIGGGQ